jgi:hypothetical protein
MGVTGIVPRLGIAAFAGAVLGLNRDLRGKPTGVRTPSFALLLVGGPFERRVHRHFPQSKDTEDG